MEKSVKSLRESIWARLLLPEITGEERKLLEMFDSSQPLSFNIGNKVRVNIHGYIKLGVINILKMWKKYPIFIP